MKRLNSKIRVSELADHSLRMVGFYKKEIPLSVDAFLSPLFAEIERKTIALSTAIKKENIISKLEEVDEQRDETIRNLRYILQGYKAMRPPVIKAAATALLAIFDRYGVKITRESYASESAHIESMLRDFSTPEAQENINKLAEVGETIEELRQRQTAFHTEKMAYEKSLSEMKGTASATSLKKPLLDLINLKLVSFLTAMKEVSAYTNLALVIEQIIKEANEITTKRGKK